MTNDTLVTSSGIVRNRSVPRVGVVSARRLYDDLFQDCLNRGIDLTYEDIKAETEREVRSEFVEASEESGQEFDDTDVDSEVDKRLQDMEIESHYFLLGAWVENSEGGYEIDKSGKSGDYALTYNTESNTVCVEWSQYTTPCNNTSPCYTMADGSGPCGDLDAPGDAVIAYTLPKDMFHKV